MDVVAYLPADPQAAEPVQVSERALHDRALGAQAGAVLGAAAGDDRLHSEVPDEPAVLVVVVTAVPEYDVRAAARSAALAAYGRYRLKQWDEAIVGSGAPTAKYDVVLTTFDKKNDSFAPHIRYLPK